MEAFDLIVVGGGVIGCAVIRAILLQQPQLRVCLIEKELELSTHQSGRNSGVVHVGYNQKPGTLKAKFVVEGSRRIGEFCRKGNIPFVQCGILVVASTDEQRETLLELFKRGQKNGARVELVDEKGLRGLEPYAAGITALYAPEGASFDSKGFVLALAREASSLGAHILLAESVVDLREEKSHIEVLTTKQKIQTQVLVNTAGLHADRLAHKIGVGHRYQIIPFRGEYYELKPDKRYMVRSHIYPPPDLAFPFLGVHLSRTFDGRVLVGPGAVLATGRECYGRFRYNFPDLTEMLMYPGFWKMFASKVFRTMMKREWKKSFFKMAVAKEARQLLPALKDTDLTAGQVGIRAQLVSCDGRIVDDLVIEETQRSIHILNAVSPALTCSLPFGDHIASLIASKL